MLSNLKRVSECRKRHGHHIAQIYEFGCRRLLLLLMCNPCLVRVCCAFHSFSCRNVAVWQVLSDTEVDLDKAKENFRDKLAKMVDQFVKDVSDKREQFAEVAPYGSDKTVQQSFDIIKKEKAKVLFCFGVGMCPRSAVYDEYDGIPRNFSFAIDGVVRVHQSFSNPVYAVSTHCC